MKRSIIFLFIFLSQSVLTQSYHWSGSGEDLDFFNENNWSHTSIGDAPVQGSIDPGQTIDFDLFLSCDVITNSGGEMDIAASTPDIFDPGPNSTWPFVYTVATLGDGNNGAQQTLEINITSLPPEGANFRIIRTNANEEWYFPNSSPLSLGLNTLHVNSVNFERSVKIQFSSGAISFDMLSLNGVSLYSTPLQSIVLAPSKTLQISQGSLKALNISGGTVVLNDDAYLHLHASESLLQEVELNFKSGLSWLCLESVRPNQTYESVLSQFLVNETIASYPSNLRLDNFYDKGTLVRPNSLNPTPLTIYSENNLSGEVATIEVDQVYGGNSIPNQMNNDVASFTLKRGYMLTMAVNADGTGKSQVFIASETDIEIHSLPESLQSNVSFIRVLPWNWVSKKGTAGDVIGMNNTWYYRWNNQGISDLQREYAPMAWGYGAANDESDILTYQSKYKSTHILGFNEPDDCNGQSGQFNNMCDEGTAVAVYQNLMKTGLRMVSPACRQGAVFNWLNSFNQLAIENDIRIDVIAVHWYDWNSDPQNSINADPQSIFIRFKSYLNQVHNLYGLPIWITEFNANKYRSFEVNRQFMELAIPYLESLDFVERYAWFEPNPVEPANIGNGEYFDSNGDLTDIGEFYKNYPSNPAIPQASFVGSNNLIDETSLNQFSSPCSPENELSNGPTLITENKKLKVFPNPATESVKLTFTFPIRDFKMYNISGLLINKELIQGQIDVSDLPTGMYIIVVDHQRCKFLKK